MNTARCIGGRGLGSASSYHNRENPFGGKGVSPPPYTHGDDFELEIEGHGPPRTPLHDLLGNFLHTDEAREQKELPLGT